MNHLSMDTGTTLIPATADTLRWGRLPARGARAVASVRPGELFTIDTHSHEGAMEDQGRDPLAYFTNLGIASDEVLPDLIDALPALKHDADHDGPHLITGPVFVDGALPGDLLQIDIVDLVRRTDYGLISDRHSKDVFAADPASRPAGSLLGTDLVSTLCLVESDPVRGDVAVLAGDDRLRVSLRPFLGIIGVATDTASELHSSPPGRHGGNLDLRHLVVGTSLYLPVQVVGALLYVGDPHFVQGNGELASTALEAPLRATLRVQVHHGIDGAGHLNGMGGVGRLNGIGGVGRLDGIGGAATLAAPVGITEQSWLVCGLDRDLGRAVRAASAAAVSLLTGAGLTPDLALAWLSVAGEVEVTQVVDGVLGAHVVIPRTDGLELLPYTAAELTIGISQ